MENLLEYLKKYHLLLIILLLLLIILIIQIFNNKPFETDNKNQDNLVSFESISNDNIKTEVEEKNVNVDIKGAIKKPGVYKLKDDSTINDVIKKAGGLLKNATTLDINLSKIVSNEMVVYISTKNEYEKRRKSIISCDSNTSVKNNFDNNQDIANIASEETKVKDYNNTTANETIITNNENNESEKISVNSNNSSGLVNINTATKEELQKINGIGLSKAEKIIAYRTENGLFKSISDIKNVSGIGESMYEKIKDHITV